MKRLVFPLVVMLSFNGFAQKLKTYEDSLRYDTKMVAFEKKFVDANLAKNREDFVFAYALYNDCLKLNPNSSAVYYELAQINLEMSNYSDAEMYIKKAIKLSPKNKDYTCFLQDLYVKMGKKG